MTRKEAYEAAVSAFDIAVEAFLKKYPEPKGPLPSQDDAEAIDALRAACKSLSHGHNRVKEHRVQDTYSKWWMDRNSKGGGRRGVSHKKRRGRRGTRRH